MTQTKKLATAALAGLMATVMLAAAPAHAGDGDKAACTGKSGCQGKGVEKSNCKTVDGKEKHACKGMNACKGNGADGKNECKGHGSCRTDGGVPLNN